MRKKIVLIGMTSSGKTTIGKILATKLNFNFIDTDKYIEKQERMKIQHIIKNRGEKEFLRIQEKRISELVKKGNYVIATGGSVVYTKNLMEKLQKISTIIFLDLPFEEIKNRIFKSDKVIICLKSKTLKEAFYERVPLYKKYANFIIDCSRVPEEIVTQIIKKLNAPIGI